MLDYLTLQTSSPDPTLLTVIYTILVCFLLSSSIAFTYIKTFKGLSYSRNYVQAVILSSIVAATIMQSIGDSLARGIGMIGALAIIRFRTNFKDPKDIIFMFAALAAGIGCGVYGYTVAVVGTLGFCVVALILHYSPLVQPGFFDGMLRFNMKNEPGNQKALESILSKYCKVFALITLREVSQGKNLEYAYHIKLKNGTSKSDIVKELRENINSINGVSLLLQETTIEL